MNFKEAFKNSRWSINQLAEESGLKPGTIQGYISRNKPSQVLLAAFDRLIQRSLKEDKERERKYNETRPPPRSYGIKEGGAMDVIKTITTKPISTQSSLVSLCKEEATTPKVAPPMRKLEADQYSGTIVSLPINQYLRRVKLDNTDEVVVAQCKKDKWRGNRQRVILKKVGDIYYVRGLL